MKPRVYLIALIAVPVIAVAVLSFARGYQPRVLQDYGEVPEFQLTDSSGRAFQKNELAGKIWIADFIFTRCGAQCPLITNKMRKLQKKLAHRNNVRLVSFSVDSDFDTPAVLADYAKKYEADPAKWYFLTGEKKALTALIQNGFRLASSDGGTGAPESITHSFKFVLVDEKGHIRGYYDGLDSDANKQLMRDTKLLLRSAPGAR